MRVKEGATGTSEMGKKRKTKQTDYHNTSDEETTKGQAGKGCSHLDKAVSLNSVKKGLKNCGIGQCTPCTNDKGSGSSVNRATSADEVDGDVLDPVIWLCLACGIQGCCRSSPFQHALKHFETPRSNSHSVAVCLANWTIWCYKCDDAIDPSDSKKLGECMEWIRRQASQQRPSEKTSSKKKSKDTVDREDSPIRTSSSPIRSPLLSREGSLPKVRGLNNLGNTCFFNAVIQNLTQTHVLRTLLHEKWSSGKQLDVPTDTHLSVSTNHNGNDLKEDKEPLTPVTITIAAMQPLTSSLIEFLDEMYKPTKSPTINPRALFNQVCNKASRFKGYQQQDSHELLRYLLDGMRAEEIKRMQAGLQVTLDIKKSAKIKNLDEATKKRIKEYGHHSKHTFVDTVFGGHLISSVKCNECQNISEILEPFLDLSLPIIEAKGSKRNTAAKPSGQQQQQQSDNQVASEGDRQTNATPGAAEAGDGKQQLSKHQLQKQKEKARKDSRRKTRRSRTTSQSEDPAEEKDSHAQSENEEEPQEEKAALAEGYRDPNDADSEASVLDRLSNAGSSRRCSEITPGGVDTGIGGLPEVPSGQELKGSQDRDKDKDKSLKDSNKDISMKDSEKDKSLESGMDRLSLSSRGSTSSSGSASRRSPLQTTNPFKMLGDEQSGTTDEDRKEDVPMKHAGKDVKSLSNKMSSLSLNGDEKNTPKVNGVMGDSDVSGGDSRKGSSDSANSKDDVTVIQNGVADVGQREKLHGGNERTTDGPSGVAPLAKIHELGESVTDINHIGAKKEKVVTITATKDDGGVNGSAPASSSKTNSSKPKPGPISTQAANKLSSMMSPPVSPVSPTSRARVASTLAPRYSSKNQECSVMSGLNQFTAPELLTGSNRFGCEVCSKAMKEEGGKNKIVYTDASKQLLIHQPPPILTLHLKRFQQVGYNLRKITRHIEFPLILDIAPFCSTACRRFANSENRVLYSLYGVVEHSGRLQFGHYTAFVKVRQPNQKLNLYTLGIPRTLNLLNETCARNEKSEGERFALREKSRMSATRKNEDGGSDGENGDNLRSSSPASLQRTKSGINSNSSSSSMANHCLPERNHIQSAVLPFHAGRNVTVPPGKWYHVSDTHVTEASESKVLNAQAYILFYERLIS